MSAKDKSPAFQWYPKDIMGSKRVALMSLAEEGAYRRALDYCWLHETLPSNPKELAMLIGKNCSVKIAEAVKKMFTQQGEELRHDRLDKERQKQKERSEIQSKNGSNGGRGHKKQVNEQSQAEAKIKPSLLNGLSETKAEESSAFAFSSASPSSELSHTHTPAGEVFDLNYFSNNGFSWNIEEPLRAALDKFLVWRQNEHTDREEITSYTQVEEILKEFLSRKITPENGAAMIDRTIRHGWKHIVYKLDEDAEAPNGKSTEKQNIKSSEWV